MKGIPNHSGAMAQPVLAVRDLSVGYEQHRGVSKVVAAGITVRISPGELVCLLGPNGAGKSTLLRTLAGMQRPLGGEVHLLGQDLFQLDPRELACLLSVVLTDRVDVGNLTGYALVALGRYPYTSWHGRLSEEDQRVVRHAIGQTGAGHLAQRRLTELSDGERQKLLIARALAQEPTLLVLDEPTAYLDLPRRVEIMGILHSLARAGGCAILLSTHDLDLALKSADTLWLLSSAGNMVAGAPEDLVLNGAFEACFHAEGVAFDVQTGSFRLHRPAVGQVDVRGDGLRALWTERALERAGFRTVRGGCCALTAVEVTGDGVTPVWDVSGAGGCRQYHTLGEVVDYVRRYVP